MAFNALAVWLLLWVGGFVAIVAGGIQLAHKRRAIGGSLLAAGLLVVLAPFAVVAYTFSPLSWPTTISVEGLDPPNDPWLTVELKHHSDFQDGTEYHFGAPGGPERVAAVFDEQHPDGVVTTEDPGVMAQGGESIWHLSTEDVRYELVHRSDPNWYELVTQVVVVRASGDAEDVRIPFPRSAFNATEIEAGKVYTNGWSQSQWADFYADVTEARVGGDTITVPTNRGTTATISLDGGLTTVTLDD